MPHIVRDSQWWSSHGATNPVRNRYSERVWVMTTPGVDHLLVPGTWLADVPRELTLEVVDRINLLIGGMNTVRNRMLLGVDSDGNEPSPGHPRSDVTAETTRRALET